MFSLRAPVLLLIQFLFLSVVHRRILLPDRNLCLRCRSYLGRCFCRSSGLCRSCLCCRSCCLCGIYRLCSFRNIGCLKSLRGFYCFSFFCIVGYFLRIRCDFLGVYCRVTGD